jgi:hypothetical protein
MTLVHNTTNWRKGQKEASSIKVTKIIFSKKVTREFPRLLTEVKLVV